MCHAGQLLSQNLGHNNLSLHHCFVSLMGRAPKLCTVLGQLHSRDVLKRYSAVMALSTQHMHLGPASVEFQCVINCFNTRAAQAAQTRSGWLRRAYVLHSAPCEHLRPSHSYQKSQCFLAEASLTCPPP